MLKPIDSKAIVGLRLQGYSPARIGELYGLSEEIIRCVLKVRSLCS